MITSRLNRQQYPASRRSQRASWDGRSPSAGLSCWLPPCRLPSCRLPPFWLAPCPLSPFWLALSLNATPRRSLPSPAVTQATPSQSSLTPEKLNSFPELTIFSAAAARASRGSGLPAPTACGASTADDHGLEARRLAELPQVPRVAGVQFVSALSERRDGGVGHVQDQVVHVAVAPVHGDQRTGVKDQRDHASTALRAASHRA